MTETFPRQKAATRNFQLGAPRSLAISSDAALVSFLRSDHGRDSVNSLWVYDIEQGLERRVADPRELLADPADIPAAERARRERMRETSSGITSYSRDDSGRRAAFTVGGALFTVDLATGAVTRIEATGPFIDPHMSPDGTAVAWSTGSSVRVWDGTADWAITPDDGATWGLADFIAAEELGRMSGLWWSPDSSELLVERVDDSGVAQVWLSDPAVPHQQPREHRYPFAGTANAEVSLYLIGRDGNNRRIELGDIEYLASIRWREQPALVVQASRDQRRFVTSVLEDGALRRIDERHDGDFLDVVPGQPRWLADSLVTVVDDHDSDTRSLAISGNVVTPRGMQVLSVTGSVGDGVDVIATRNGLDRFAAHVTRDGDITELTDTGVWAAAAPVSAHGSTWRVVVGSQLAGMHRTTELRRDNEVLHVFDSHAERPRVDPVVHWMRTGPFEVATAVLFPTGHVPGSTRLPVLMRPYGGPHGSQVLNSALIHVEDQWYADQGFAVVVADGRGTPGRGPAFERAVAGDFAGPVLADQVSALADVAAAFPHDIDSARVGIMGWSFGGYLAALAVLDRPDVFHAAVAGAPVTEWRWYDTAYTERYLGHPDEHPEAYHRSSLLHRAVDLSRPLMLVHGLADDNVLARHTLALSGELLTHRKPHTVLPLSGVTHMTPQEVVTENLMHLTLEFLQHHLASDGSV